MNDELLARASRALRQQHDGSSDRAAATEMWIVARAAGRARRRTRNTWVFSIAAVLAVSSAWAAGPVLWPLAHRAAAWMVQPHAAAPLPPPTSSSPSTRGEPSRRAAEAGDNAAAEPAASAPSPATEPSGLLEDPANAATNAAPTVSAADDPRAGLAARFGNAHRVPNAAARGSARVPADPRDVPNAAAPAPAASTAASDGDAEALRLYREAHRVHFVDRDAAKALAAWDRYLAASRGGPLVVEARYNRALALVRLNRRTEAVEALAPFVVGEYGAYRQREAEALTQKLTGAGAAGPSK